MDENIDESEIILESDPSPDERFGQHLTSSAVEGLSESVKSRNTQARNKWAMSMFKRWMEHPESKLCELHGRRIK